MKNLFILGSLFVIVGATLSTNTEASGVWLFQSGFVFLFGALIIFIIKKHLNSEYSTVWKIVGIISFVLVLFLIILGFINGAWDAHPLGFIIAFAGCIWTLYLIKKERQTNPKNIL